MEQRHVSPPRKGIPHQAQNAALYAFQQTSQFSGMNFVDSLTPSATHQMAHSAANPFLVSLQQLSNFGQASSANQQAVLAAAHAEQQQAAYSQIVQQANSQFSSAFGQMPINYANMGGVNMNTLMQTQKTLNTSNGFALDLIGSGSGRASTISAGCSQSNHIGLNGNASVAAAVSLQQHQQSLNNSGTNSFGYGVTVPTTSAVRNSVNMLGMAQQQGTGNQHAVDQLEEALSTLGRDYNLTDDFGELAGSDFNEHLLRDAFFGSAALQQAPMAHAASHVGHTATAQQPGGQGSRYTWTSVAAASSAVSAVVDSLHSDAMPQAAHASSVGGAGSASNSNSAIHTTSNPSDVLHSIFDFDPSSLTVKDDSVTLAPKDTSDVSLEPSASTHEESQDNSLLFGAAPPKSVRESPVTIANSRPAETSTVKAVAPVEVAVPKAKEKIRLRRDKELAEIDRAFDRHLSLVAEKNARAARTLTELELPALPSVNQAHTPQASDASTSDVNSPRVHNTDGFRFTAASTSFDDAISPQASTSKSTECVASTSRAGGAVSPARFSPCRFSPDRDDETSNQTPSVVVPDMIFGLPPASSTPSKATSGATEPAVASEPIQVFIPKDKKQSTPKKVPIYRLMTSPLAPSAASLVKQEVDVVNDVPPPVQAEDAYDFDEFDEEDRPESSNKEPKDSDADRSVEAKILSPSRRTRGDSAHYDSKDGVADADTNGGDLWRHVVPKKRHTVSMSAEKSTPAAPLLPPDAALSTVPLLPPPPPRQKTAAEILSEKLNEQLNAKLEWKKAHGFAVSEVKSSKADRNTAGSTGKIPGRGRGRPPRRSKDALDTLEPIVPKVIIRIPKMVIKRDPDLDDSVSIAGTIKDEDDDESISRKKKKKHKKHKKHKHKSRDRSPIDLGADANGMVENGSANHVAMHSAADPATTHFSRKRRIMDEWARDAAATVQTPDTQPPRKESPPSLFEQLAAKFGAPPATAAEESNQSLSAQVTDNDTSRTNMDAPPASVNSNISISEHIKDTPCSSLVSSKTCSPSATSCSSPKSKKKKHKHRHRDKDRLADNKEDIPKYEVFIADDPTSTYEKLSHFRMSLKALQKGQYVAHKADLHLVDCPLWKVDNQNLLQKFPPEDQHGRLVYRNSSTYAGWCPQSAEKYVVISVRFVKHSRSEVVVEPETPLADLIPAVIGTNEQNEENSATTSTSVPQVLPDEDDDDECAMDSMQPSTSARSQSANELTVADQPLRDALETYLHALTMHVINGNALTTIRQNNEWKFLRHINDVDQLNQQKIGRLLVDCRWPTEYRTAIQLYIHFTVEPIDPVSDLLCQACEQQPATQAALCFGDFFYDDASFELKPVKTAFDGTAVPADFVVCAKCSRVSTLYHRLCHIRYNMFTACETQVDCIRADKQCLQPNVLLDECLHNREWMKPVVQHTLKVWRDVTEELTVDGV